MAQSQSNPRVPFPGAVLWGGEDGGLRRHGCFTHTVTVFLTAASIYEDTSYERDQLAMSGSTDYPSSRLPQTPVYS